MKAIADLKRGIWQAALTFICALFVAAISPYAKADPILLKDYGSFYVGGRTVTSAALTGSPAGLAGMPNQGDITVDQMYVR